MSGQAEEARKSTGSLEDEPTAKAKRRGVEAPYWTGEPMRVEVGGREPTSSRDYARIDPTRTDDTRDEDEDQLQHSQQSLSINSSKSNMSELLTVQAGWL